MCTPNTKLLPILIELILIHLLCGCNFKSPNESLPILPYDLSYLDNSSAPEEAKLADVLLIGSTDAKVLEPYLKAEFSKYESPPTFFALTAEEYNLARLSYILKGQEFTPKWVIYLPSENEEKEELFDIKDSSDIQFNIKRMNTWWWRILFKIWKPISLSLLKKTSPLTLTNEKKILLSPLSDGQKIDTSLTHLSIFRILLEDLILHYNETNFILITMPFDSSEAPSNCKTKLSWPTKSTSKEIYKLIEENKWEESLQKSNELISLAPYYATSYYLKAKILKHLNHTKESTEMINLSWILNCRSPTVSLKNKIIKAIADKYTTRAHLYDLSNYVTESCFEVKTQACFEELHLNTKYYEQVAKIINQLLNK